MSTLDGESLFCCVVVPFWFRETVWLAPYGSPTQWDVGGQILAQCFWLVLPGLRVLGYGEILLIVFPTSSLCLGVLGMYWTLFLSFATCFEITLIVFTDFFGGKMLSQENGLEGTEDDESAAGILEPKSLPEVTFIRNCYLR